MREPRIHPAEGTKAAISPVSDATLVAAARVDRLAFAPLYERYRDDLLRCRIMAGFRECRSCSSWKAT